MHDFPGHALRPNISLAPQRGVEGGACGTASLCETPSCVHLLRREVQAKRFAEFANREEAASGPGLGEEVRLVIARRNSNSTSHIFMSQRSMNLYLLSGAPSHPTEKTNGAANTRRLRNMHRKSNYTRIPGWA